jgi:FKBP-type peptidyl-prolyl cis-trans isomerase
MWVQSRALDDLIDYSWEQRTKVEGLGLAVLQVFCDRPPDAETNATLRAVAAAHKGSVALMVFRTETSSYMMEDYGFAADAPMPRLGVSPSFEYDAPKYAYAGELAAAPIIAYVASFLGGELRPTLKSADAPTEAWVAGTARVVVGSTLRSEVVESDDDVLIAFHAPYGFDEVNATLARLARLAVAAAPALKIASFNTMENAFEPALFPGVDKYHADPIVMVWSGKGEGRSMKRLTKGKPTLKTLLPFAKKHSPALKLHWDTVKAALDDDNKRIADEKAKAKAKAAAELVELKEKAEAAKIERLCCDGDDGITKKVLVAGSGEMRPKRGARVKAHFTGRVSTTCVEVDLDGECAPAAAPFEGEQFASSRHGLGGAPFEFTLGEGRVLDGLGAWKWLGKGLRDVGGSSLDVGFATMKPGERALLTIKAEYAYGDEGSPPKVPPRATLEFDVELIGADAYDYPKQFYDFNYKDEM